MKHKHVKVGQRVIVKHSTLGIDRPAAGHIGGTFEVSRVESLDYTGDLTVFVSEKEDREVQFWCSHKDIELAEGGEKKPRVPKVGDLFEVMGDEYMWHAFKLGSTVRLKRVEPDGIHPYENMDGATQFVDTRDVRRLTKQEIWARLVSKRLTHA